MCYFFFSETLHSFEMNMNVHKYSSMKILLNWQLLAIIRKSEKKIVHAGYHAFT